MKSFTINLRRSLKRREYVIKELSKTPFINNKFIEGVDGSLLSHEELNEFNQERAYKRYGRSLKLGEIGCTLSHRKCYQSLLDDNNDAVIIFEDDIFIRNANRSVWDYLYSYLETVKHPTIILLSGGFWYLNNTSTLNPNLYNVYNAYYTHSYMINRAAAELLLRFDADYLADDWRLLKKRGIKLFAYRPHLVDQQWDGTVPSMIQNEAKHWFNSLSLTNKIKSYLGVIPCKILGLLGRHEIDSFDNFTQI
ncbi:MAG: glycosyltransferase family 25 protein [Bacteroidales bacterium]|nr:glycosyltransferase family 25 protein [Bacteroidales bacterium]